MTVPAPTTDVASRIVDSLYLSDPELDTSIGTPLRKIIDAVSEQIAQGTNDSYLIDYQYDIDSKVGGDLDDFCANFGIARLLGVRATGTLTFSRSTQIASTSATVIPPGTQAVTGTIPSQTFQTTVATTMDVGQTAVDVPAQSLYVGPDGNILANTPLQLASSVGGVSNVSNAGAFIGGTLDETDSQLRARFKSTVFRNLAGTEAMYRGIALQTLANENAGSFGVAQVNVLGATFHNVEQIQFVSGSGTSSLHSSAYYVTQSVTILDGDGNIYAPQTQFTATANNTVTPATLTITTGGAAAGMPDGVYNVEYDYVPIASRNDPFNTRFGHGVVGNRVDIIVNGQTPAAASQSAAYVTAVKFNATVTDPLYHNKFVNLAGANPPVNDVFIPLGYGPILTLPTSFAIGGQTYNLGTHYDIIHQDDAFGYAPNSLFGIWWKTTTNTTNPPNNTTFMVTSTSATDNNGVTTTTGYTYNTTPSDVQGNLANWRLLGTDVQVHAGKPAYLVFNFAVVYDRNVNVATVNGNIQSALDSFLKRLGFNAAIQISDIIQVAHNVQGVDNIRLLTSTDNGSTYGIQQVQNNGSVIQNYNISGRPTDVYFDERTYPLLYSVALTAKAPNTFRS